jgi:hypothetical protein
VRPKQDQIQSAYYGEKPSREAALLIVKNYMSNILIDPYSATYDCDTPRKAWANHVGRIYYGYVVFCDINAKNRFGGYVGSELSGFLLNSGKVVLDRWANIGYVSYKTPGDTVQTPWIGMSVKEGKVLGLVASMSGVVVTRVQTGGPAEHAGIQVGDQVLSVDGKPIETWADIAGAVEKARIGQPLDLEIKRSGRMRLVTLRVSAE